MARHLAMLMLSLALIGCGETDTPEPRSEAPAANPTAPGAPTAARPEPDEAQALQTLPRLDADAIEALVAESAAGGRITVIDFWATWCAPCVAMFPELHEGLKAMGDRVRPVTITLDAPGRYEQQAIRFLDQHHALEDAYLLIPDTDAQIEVVNRIADSWNDLVVPAVFVYDASGNLVGEFVGTGDAQPILDATRALLPAE